MTSEVIKLPNKLPTTLAQAASGLKRAAAGVGAHQRMALANAIAAGFYLHYAQSQFTSHRDPKWVKWREENFDGDESLARRYVRVARAFAISGGTEIPRGSIREADEWASTIDVPKDLPAILSDYGKDPKEIEEREAKRLREEQELREFKRDMQRDLQKKREEHERREQERERQEQEELRRDGKEGREREKREEQAEPLARKIESLIRKALSSTEEGERHVFIDKAAELLAKHGFAYEVMVME